MVPMSRGEEVRAAVQVALPPRAFEILDVAIRSLDIRAAHVLEHAATFAQFMCASDILAWCDRVKEDENGGEVKMLVSTSNFRPTS